MAIDTFPEKFRELWNNHDLAIVACYAEDAILRDSGQIPRDLVGKRDIEAFYADQWRGAPKSSMAFHRTAIEGNVIFVEWEWWPLGQDASFSVRGMSVWTLSDGRIHRDITYFDPTEARNTELPWEGFVDDPPEPPSAGRPDLASTGPADGDDAPATQNPFVEAFFDTWNSHAVDSMAELYADDAVMVDSGLFTGQLEGRAAIAAYYEDQWTSSPHARIRAVNIATKDTQLFVEWSWRPLGHASDLDVRGVSVWTVPDGKIVHDLTYWDPTALRGSDATWKQLMTKPDSK